MLPLLCGALFVSICVGDPESTMLDVPIGTGLCSTRSSSE